MALYLWDVISDKSASPAILKQNDKMLKTPFKHNHCDGAHHFAGRGPQGREAGV